jgi:hypothetical protein
MKPVNFHQQNTVWGKDQWPQYLPLPAYSDERETVSCWQLTWCERLKILVTGRLWLRQLNFGRRLQPQSPCVDSPFVDTGFPDMTGI